MWEFEQVFSVISQMIKIILIQMSFLLWEPKDCWNEGFFYNRDDFLIPASVFWEGSIALYGKSYSEWSTFSVASDRNLLSGVQNFLRRIKFDVDKRISIVLITQSLK